MTTQAEKDAVLAALKHAVGDILAAQKTVAAWPVDGGSGGVVGIKEVGEALAAGEWGPVQTLNIDRFVSLPTRPSGTGIAHYFSGPAPWNKADGTLDFIGADHGGPVDLHRYHADTNSWDVPIPCIGSHGYYQTAVGADGTVYRLMCETEKHGVYTIDKATGADTFYCDTENFTQAITSGVLLWVGDRLGLYSGNSGLFYAESTPGSKAWEVIARTPRSMNNAVGAYSEKFHAVIYGGGLQTDTDGRQLYLLDLASELVTTLPPAPYPVHIGIGGCNLNVGQDGHGYIYGYGEHWRLDFDTEQWEKLATPPAGVWYPNDDEAVISCNTPWALMYVMAKSINGTRTYQVWAYKPALVAAATAPVIVSFTAAPQVLPAGGGVVALTWATEGAARVEIAHTNGEFIDEYLANGSADFTIAQNTTFELEAFADETDDNSVTATVTVKLLPPTTAEPPKIMSFTAEPGGLPVGGGEVTLAWATENATMVIIGETPVDLSGSAPLQVTSSCRLTIKAIGDVHPIATAYVDVTVQEVAQTGDWMPSIGSSVGSAQYNFCPRGDYYRNDSLPEYIPFSCFDDPTFGIIARSAEGKVLQKRRIHVNGATWQTYSRVAVVQDGAIYQRDDKHATDDMAWLANQLRIDQPRLGRRGEGYPGPYFTAHSHPNAITAGSLNAPVFMCLRAEGLFFGLMPTGDTQKMFMLDQTIKAYHDFTLTDDPQVLYVTCAYEGKLRKITRSALNVVSERDVAPGIGFVTSVRYVGGMLYACDNVGSNIWKIDPATGAKSVLTTAIGAPFWISDTEDPDQIVVLASPLAVHYVNTKTGVAGPNFFPPAGAVNVGFGTIDCDINGTFGPKGDLMVAITATTYMGTNNVVYHYSKPGQYWGGSPFHPPNPTQPGWDLPLLGVGRGQEPGHYLWGSFYHRQQGLVAVWGHSQTACNFVRIVLPGDPPEDDYEVISNSDPGAPNRAAANHGLQCLIYGAPSHAPYCHYPSATCTINSSMWGLYSGDSFAALSIEERKEWIYNGFGGIHPRPEFREDDYSTWAIGYSLLTNSQEWLRRGTACTNEWRAAFPATMPPTPLPPVPSYNSHFLQCYKEGEGLTTYLMDKDTGQHPIAAGTAIDLYADYGSPWVKKLATVTGTGANTVRWEGPLGLPPGRYVTSAVAPGFVCQATITDVAETPAVARTRRAKRR